MVTFISFLFTFCSFSDDHYVSQINPALNELGYDSVFKKRTGDKKDGCAIFYKREKVKMSKTRQIKSLLKSLIPWYFY